MDGIGQVEYGLISDEALVCLAQEGDRLAEQAVCERFMGMVYAKARPYFLVGADRADIVQEGSIGLFSAIRDYDAGRNVSFRSFAELCVTRQILTAIKSATRKKHIPLNSYISLDRPVYSDDGQGSSLGDTLAGRHGINPEELVIDRETAQTIHEAIMCSLSEFELMVLDKFMEGKSYSEIAAAVNRSTKSVDNALQRIKRKTLGVLNADNA